MRAEWVLAALLACAAPAMAAPDREAASAAFDEGDTARALALYDEILAADPNDAEALLRSGMLLAWSRRFDEAIARYDRALAHDPSSEKLLLERGKAFLWSGRYDEAVRGFESVLRLDPREPWALCGTAQAYAWRGRGAEARPFYERALEVDPDFKEAGLGLAYVELEDGDVASAAARTSKLAARYPDDTEVAALTAAVRRARGAWIQAGWDRANDSDEIRSNVYRLEGGLGLPKRLDLRFVYAHSDLRGPAAGGPDAAADADALYGVLGWTPAQRRRGELRLGAVRTVDSLDRERTAATGGVSYGFPIDGWDARAAVSRDPFLYSPRILESEIDITSITLGAGGPVGSRVRVEADAGYGDFSDGNGRVGVNAGAWYVWTWTGRSLRAGGVVRYLDFSDDLDHGYFDPQGLIAAVASLRSDGGVGASKWEYEATLEAGVQSYTFDGVDASGKFLGSAYGQLARPLARALSFQVYGGVGNSSTASGPGFTSVTFGLRLKWTLGGA